MRAIRSSPSVILPTILLTFVLDMLVLSWPACPTTRPANHQGPQQEACPGE